MRVSRVLVVSWLVGLSVGVFAACSGTPRCSASTCSGCCDASGECQLGTQLNACGLSGATCQQCIIGASCVNGFCIGGSAGGGAGGGASGGGAGGGASGGGSGGGSGEASFRAYQLTIEGTSIVSPSCYRENILPSAPDVEPLRTLEVLVWDTSTGEQFVSLAELQPYTLAHSPTITPPQGARMDTTKGHFVFQRNVQSVFPGRNAFEIRQTQLELTFADSSAASTTGTLKLTSQYTCAAGGDACPTPNPTPDSASSCSAVLAFNAQQVPVTAKWTTPTGAALGGATRYLTASVQPMSNDPSCFYRNVLTYPHVAENGAVDLDVWQRTASGDRIRTAPMTFQLGSAPTVHVMDDFVSNAGVYEVTSHTATPFPGVQATEERDTRVSFTFAGGSEVHGMLQLSAQYACIPGSEPCPDPNPSRDSASCSMSTDFVAVQLP